MEEAKTTTRFKNELLFVGGSQRFMGDWVKEYGFLGIPLGIAIILIIAIVIITRSKKNE